MTVSRIERECRRIVVSARQSMLGAAAVCPVLAASTRRSTLGAVVTGEGLPARGSDTGPGLVTGEKLWLASETTAFTRADRYQE
jgi:hypothetical protein